jgi:hypothetical protein
MALRHSASPLFCGNARLSMVPRLSTRAPRGRTDTTNRCISDRECVSAEPS